MEVNLKGQNANLSIIVSHGMHLRFNASSDFAWFELVLVWFSRVNRSVNKHLRIQRRQNSHIVHLLMNVKEKFVTFQLLFPTQQKLINSIKEWEDMGCFM